MIRVRSDAEVIAASRHDPVEFAAIFDRHFASVFGFVARRIGHDPAGDVASEVFTRAFTCRESYRLEVPDARPWLLGIAANLVLTERRRFARYLAAIDRLGSSAAAEGEDAAEALIDIGRPLGGPPKPRTGGPVLDGPVVDDTHPYASGSVPPAP